MKNLKIVVSHFVSKGYQIADKWLLNNYSDTISNIGIVLGTDDDEIIPMSTKLFGETNKKSTYLETELGVVFSGNIDRMIENLPHLPSKCITSNYATCAVPFEATKNCAQQEGTVSNAFCGPDEFTYDGKFLIDCVRDLNVVFDETLHIANPIQNEIEVSQTNIKLIEHVLENTHRDEEGRLVMPLAWNGKNSHLLSQNYNLSKQILNSTLKKLQKDPVRLEMYDSVFREQQKMGIIEKIPNLEEFMQLHPECSFMAHMGVYRMGSESTKCRVVFLSNICERKNGKGLSHNQVMLPGPCLNQKMSTAIMFLRFDKYLLTFDLKKAFSMIKLNEIDQNRLLFIWYNNINKGDYTLVGYKSLRLPFGLVSSPFLLMSGLYKILIMDQTDDDQIEQVKKSIYNNIYMDNGSYTCNDTENLYNSYFALPKIFSPYKFDLQQFCTNDPDLQSTIDKNETSTPDKVKLFGMIWDRSEDTLSPVKINLDEKSNTKRKILSSLNGIYDLFNIYAPILLRAKLFLQKLHLNKDLTWDSDLPSDFQREWENISRQANSTPIIHIDRNVGRRDSVYELIAFTDASSNAYGCVLYLKDIETSQVNFFSSKSKVLSSDMKKKTMPALELQGVEFGVECLMDVYKSLTGDTVVMPIKIDSLHLFTDSTTCLHWIESYSIKYNKVQKFTVFVNNRLNNIEQHCTNKPVSFRHISGEMNPSDCLTRPFSYKTLQNTCFYSGPEFLKTPLCNVSMDHVVNIPNPILRCRDEVPTHHLGEPLATCAQAHAAATIRAPEHLVPVDKFSKFTTLVRTCRYVLMFIHKLKLKVTCKKGVQDNNLNINFYERAFNMVIRTEQQIFYPEIFEYFGSLSKAKREIPEQISQFNLYIDDVGILRIKSKIPAEYNSRPILLHKNSVLTKMIVKNIHESMSHSGIYPTLKEFRKKFWIRNYFSLVGKILKDCVVCRRFNEPPIKLNQNAYREFRVNPSQIPYSDVFIDYAGPFLCNMNGNRTKIWLLLITCLYTRAVDIKICRSADVRDFMRALQLHIFEFGIFQNCYSDLGSQIQAGSNVISAFLNDLETKEYFESNNIKVTKFEQFSKGNSSLGSLIEVCVKQVKHLIYKCIRNIVLDYFDFEFIVCKTIDLINKRPIAFKESLRTLGPNELPFCITPEILMRGYETVTLNIIPQMQCSNIDDEGDPDFEPYSNNIVQGYERLLKVKSNLIEAYHSEFLATLINQAIDKKDRYKPVNHKVIKSGDIVLLVDKHTKRYHYPMARVDRVVINTLGEVTAAYVFKGSTKELVYRHMTSLILLISSDGFTKDSIESALVDTSDSSLTDPPNSSDFDEGSVKAVRKQPHRMAAKKCRELLKLQTD